MKLRTRLYRPAMLALLAGLAPAAAFACTITDVATLPLTLEGGHYVTPARIDDAPVRMLVDTGAATSAVDRALAARLNLPRDRLNRSAIIGVGGTGRPRPTPVARTLELPGLTLHDVRLAEGDFGTNRATPLAAILGADILGRHDVEIDPARHRLVLHDVTACEGRFVDWPRVQALPMTPFFNGSLHLVPITLDDTVLMALVDTGATETVLFRHGAARLGQAARRASGDRRGFGIGSVAGRRVTMFAHRFTSLRIGTEVEAAPTVSVADTDVAGLDMVLGLDILNRHRFWISTASGQMFLVRIGGEPAAH